jgi:hypothetical protein
MKVVAYESITVPAGTFKCFRIEGDSDWINTLAGGGFEYVLTEKWRITNWYCPDVRYIGKSHTERYIGGNDLVRKSAYRTLDHELIGHRRGRTTPASALAKSDESSAEKPVQPSTFDGIWEGEQGIWRIKGRISGEKIEGTIQCRTDKGWSARSPSFAGTVEKDGSVDADTAEDLQGWAARQIDGKLPDLRVVGFGKLNCPNGEVSMKKVE